MGLDEFFKEHPKAALGFSGGVDSAYLLYAALKAGADVRPYFVKTPFQPEFELEDAIRLTEELGVRLHIVELDVLKEAQVAENPQNRCYYCKRALFGALQKQAMADGYHLLLDGTNASDVDADRPGIRALRELEVRSPLREAGLGKAEIRSLSKDAGLFTWDKPAYACLATRVPTGTEITREMLQKVEAGEAFLHSLGFRDLRLRLFHGAARLQFTEDQLPMALENRLMIRQGLAPWFDTVMLDLKER